jgi:hypothetical protein
MFPGGKGGRCVGLATYYLHVPIVLKSGSLGLLEPKGPVQACNGIALKCKNKYKNWLSKSQLLPYFAQLAKVFSQGKYYAGGPRKVQICRNSLLTNTLIMRVCLFIIVINYCLSRTISGTCVPICLFIVTVSTKYCPSLASSLAKQIPH